MRTLMGAPDTALKVWATAIIAMTIPWLGCAHLPAACLKVQSCPSIAKCMKPPCYIPMQETSLSQSGSTTTCLVDLPKGVYLLGLLLKPPVVNTDAVYQGDMLVSIHLYNKYGEIVRDASIDLSREAFLGRPCNHNATGECFYHAGQIRYIPPSSPPSGFSHDETKDIFVDREPRPPSAERDEAFLYIESASRYCLSVTFTGSDPRLESLAASIAIASVER